MIAFSSTPPTAPPLIPISTFFPAPVSTLMAESPLSEPPETFPAKLIETSPLPCCVTNTPWRPLVVTGPLALTSTLALCS